MYIVDQYKHISHMVVAQNQKSVHDQYTLDILAVHKNQYNQYIKNSNVLINQYTKNLNFSTWKDYFQYNKKT